MKAAGIRVVGVTGHDWRQLRELRLQALADTPHAFMETLLHAVEQNDENWQARARRCEDPDYVGFAAVDDRRWVGTMRGEITSAGKAWLLGVFVAPSHRGRALGVADALLNSVEGWVRDRGCRVLSLDVHEDNVRAQAFYLRRGYSFTGYRQPYPLQESESELRMSRAL